MSRIRGCVAILLKITVAIAMLAIAGFFAFGFLATFEPPGAAALRLAYAIGGMLALAAAVAATIGAARATAGRRRTSGRGRK